MKRAITILTTGALLAILSFAGLYWIRTAPDRELLDCAAPELAWLKHEFHLNDSEFERIAEIHEAYVPQCIDRCRRIAAKNAELEALLATAKGMSPEIEKKLEEAGQIRVECQKAMLEHFLEVSRMMPSEQSKRYMAWVQESTLLRDSGMRMGGD